MAITLTENAAKKIKAKLVKNSNEGLGLRVGVKKVGCSGFAYTFDYANHVNSDDIVFESHNVMLMVDAASLPFLDGSHIDFVREGLNETFKFDNPNADGECGCGESFNLKNTVLST